jgi:hypothetical protein
MFIPAAKVQQIDSTVRILGNSEIVEIYSGKEDHEKLRQPRTGLDQLGSLEGCSPEATSAQW